MATPCKERDTTARSGADDVASPRTIVSTDDVASPRTILSTDDVASPRTILSTDDVASPRTIVSTDDVASPRTIVSTDDVASPRTIVSTDDVASPRTIVSTDDVASPRTIVSTDDVASPRTIVSTDDVASPRTIVSTDDVASPRTIVSTDDVASPRTIVSTDDVASPRTIVSTDDVASPRTIVSTDDVASPRTILSTDDVASPRTIVSTDDVASPRTVLSTDDVASPRTIVSTDDVASPRTILSTDDVASPRTILSTDDVASPRTILSADDVTSPETTLPTDDVTPPGTILPDTAASDLQLSTEDNEPINQPCHVTGRDIQGGAELLSMGEVLRSQLQDSETSFVQANSQVVADSERSRCVQTDDLEEASDILQETGRVILCGFTGTGKTTVGHALLRRCREEGFKPYILSKLEDWHAHIGPGRRSFVLIDDLMGVVRVNRQQYEEWTKILRNMLELIKTGDCRVVVTLYPHVLHELQQLETDSQSPLLDTSAVVRLMTDDLDTEVKRALLDFHLKQLPRQPSQQQELVERIVQADTSGPAFLWCCRYLVDHWQAVEDPATVFTSPAEANSVLLKQMCLHDTHGDSFAAVFVLTMLGKGRFLHGKERAQAELLDHGFRGHCDDHLAKYEDFLLGSVLASQGHGFISRVMYDAAGFALGRSFRLPTLLRVCDVTFLVQHVRAIVKVGQLMRVNKVLDIQVGSKCFDTEARKNPDVLENCQSLVERLHEEVIKGNLKEISPHPALQCPEFLLEMEKYCEKEKHSEHHLLRALDTVYNLPLIYWSVRNKCHGLSEWCINKMNADKDLHHTLHDTLLACCLFPHLAHELGHKSEQLSFQGLLAAEICQVFTGKKLLSREYIAKHNVGKNANFHGMMTGTKESWKHLYYLCDTDLPIPLDLITVQMPDNKPMSNASPIASVHVSNNSVTVQVRDRGDWYLALRLLADREVNETDRDGNTLLHIAVDKINLKAITLAVKSGACLTKTNNKGLTPYQLAQRRRKELNNATDRNKMAFDLFSVIRGGNDVTVKTLLCYGSSVHDKDDEGRTGLLVACKAGQGNIADLLIDLGADVNVMVSLLLEGPQIPLFFACHTGLIRTVELLLKHNAVIDAINKWKETALHCACQCESPTASADITRLLLDAGADVNARDTLGMTPLHDAAWNGYTETLRRLIHYEADLNAKDNEGRTPLHCASTASRPGIIITQLVEAKAETGRVHQAVVRGDVDALMTLLQQGADVNQHDTSMGCSPLHTACLLGRTDIVTWLTQHGAKVNAVDAMKKTPLHYVCAAGQTHVARQLIDEGADVNASDEPKSTPLHEAADKGNIEIVVCLLEHGAQVDATADNNTTRLHTACENGHAETWQCLLQHGADVNAVSEWNGTPLHTACQNGHTQTAQCLLQHGANVNSVSKWNETPLHRACEKGHTQTAQYLLQHGADVNAVSEWNGTPLHTACEKDHTQTAQCLLPYGAHVNAVSEWKKTPLHTASEKAHTETAQLLVQFGVDLDAVLECYGTPLHTACRNGHTETAQYLLQHGADVNAETTLNCTPLHLACRHGHTETAQCLLQHGADVNAVSERYGTSLHTAFKNGHTETAQCLLQHGANVNSVSKWNEIPLHTACEKGHTETAQCLLQHGADVNAVSEKDDTPLHTACKNGHTETAQCLLQHGANVNTVSEGIETPLHTACEKGHTEIAQSLLQHGADVNSVSKWNETPLYTACENGHTETAQCLLQHGANVNSVSKWKQTPLYGACEKGHTQTAQCLLQHGADLNAVSDCDETPLHAACNNGHTETAQYLLQHQANVNAVSGCDETPLHTACKKGHTETAQYLLQHGADVNAVSKVYGTPLHKACENGHTQTAQCLLQHGADVNAVSQKDGTSLHKACEKALRQRSISCGIKPT
ncbi:hypothetical protein V1264_005934 [Littorina saxatilis]|uniref:Novel STAND NTPase 3 domain-containing protein n=2 Tax=Littorina saxatilis TaxID=31220 RepID=A0AAN9AXP9_9CAEN